LSSGHVVRDRMGYKLRIVIGHLLAAWVAVPGGAQRGATFRAGTRLAAVIAPQLTAAWTGWRLLLAAWIAVIRGAERIIAARAGTRLTAVISPECPTRWERRLLLAAWIAVPGGAQGVITIWTVA
jgi:hypothetical protein